MIEREAEPETELRGGNANGAVVRIGGTVHRQCSPQSETIQRLLRYVRDAGVTWVPEPLGFDDRGREMVGYIEGEVAHGEPDFRADAAVLTDVARALRQWHDATVGFPPSDEDVWFPHAKAVAHGVIAHGVIAHNDFAPYNHVFRDGQFVGAIDFDVCYPASRPWDLAWTLYRYVYLPAFVSLAPAAGEPWPELSPIPAREIAAACAPAAEVFMRAYGDLTVGDVLTAMPARLVSMAAWCAAQDSSEHRAWGLMYSAHARWGAALAATPTA